ncbi:MAG: GIY-YIG nuclease family protein [Candidatus Pacebacteria bacterium]|nr:GIY-YIG nuclease family protein [Candidatus Paceibacterota bacterium]
MSYLYILQSVKNSSYYIGSTINLKNRLKQHRQGEAKYTRLILPVKLVFFQRFSSLKLARRAEAWLKKQKDRGLIKRIIRDGKLNKCFS